MNDPTHSRYRHLRLKGSGPYARFERKNNEIKEKILKYQRDYIPAHGSYGALMFDPRWRAKRLEILNRDSHRCKVCNGTSNLQVHHRQYHFVVERNQFKQPWDYPGNLLMTLCESCHKLGHSKYKVLTVNI